MKKALVLVVAAVAILFASCTSFQVSGVQVSTQKDSRQVVGDFNISVPVFKLLGGAGGITLFNIMSDASDSAIQNAIKAEIQRLGGTAAIDVKIEYGASFIDILLNGITGSIVAPATAKISGKVVK